MPLFPFFSLYWLSFSSRSFLFYYLCIPCLPNGGYNFPKQYSHALKTSNPLFTWKKSYSLALFLFQFKMESPAFLLACNHKVSNLEVRTTDSKWVIVNNTVNKSMSLGKSLNYWYPPFQEKENQNLGLWYMYMFLVLGFYLCKSNLSLALYFTALPAYSFKWREHHVPWIT